MAEETTNFKQIFQTKYDEFCTELSLSVPELESQIAAAKALSLEDRMVKFTTEVIPVNPPNRKKDLCPAFVLPGVPLNPDIWNELGEVTQGAIQEYITLLSMCCLFEGGVDKDTMFGAGTEWMGDFLKNMKDKMSSVDFESMAKKMAGLFGMDGSKMPKLPEKFLKGHLARLAEEIMKDFTPEDLGLDEETIRRCEADPMNAFELLMKMYSQNPNFIQNTVQKIGKRLASKIQSGAINPATIVAEAEELMKTFSENPAFVDLMESFRGMFGMDELSKAPGAVGQSAKLALARERLRKKHEQSKAAAAAAAVAAAANPTSNTIINPFTIFTEAELNERSGTGNSRTNTKGKKKGGK